MTRKNPIAPVDPEKQRGREPATNRIPVAKPDLGQAEIDAVVQVLSDEECRLSLGERLQRFEQQMRDHAGTRFAVAVSSGTAGLHLCMIAAGVQRGDLVITSPFSFVASANCILHQSAVPVFVDVDEQTGNLDPEQVREAAEALQRSRRRLPRRIDTLPIGGRLAAILPVHTFGQPADMDPLLGLARECGVPLVEDACEALGSEYHGRRVGNLGSDAAVFAFFPNKQVTTGEGGMIVTDREEWANQFVSLRNQGRDALSDGAFSEQRRLGFNYRLDEMSAALGCVQMARLEELLQRRERVASLLEDGLEGLELIERPRIVGHTTRMSWFVYVIRLNPPLSRTRVMRALQERGIESRPYFSPIHLQPFYRERFGYRKGDYPIAERLGERSLALPFFPGMTEDQVARVCRSLCDVVKQPGSNR